MHIYHAFSFPLDKIASSMVIMSTMHCGVLLVLIPFLPLAGVEEFGPVVERTSLAKVASPKVMPIIDTMC